MAPDLFKLSISFYQGEFCKPVGKGGVNNGKNIHVTKHGDHWSVMQEYAQRSSGNFATQQEAFERAREIAMNNQQEVCIHGVDGKIRAKYSYGPDDCPPIG